MTSHAIRRRIRREFHASVFGALPSLGQEDRGKPSRARRTVFAFAGAAAGLVMADGVRAYGAAVVLAGAGWRWPELARNRKFESNRKEVVASLPDALDLMAAAARAGVGVAQMFALTATRVAGPLGEAMRDAVSAIEHGLPRHVAYDILIQKTGAAEVAAVVEALRRAERLGSSVSVTLSELAAEMREERRAAAEENARGTPIRMLFPVVFCFLPAFGLLTVAPVVIVALRSFRSG